jgi:hypothetical protein
MPNTQTSVPAFTAGQVLTAQQMTEVNTGLPVFASGTTRNAAFGGTGEKTLAEGQLAYLEDVNLLQVYNGTAWVNLNGTGARVETNQTTSSITYTDLATVGPSVTTDTGTSALVSISATIYNTAAIGNTGFLSVDVSGASTIAAADGTGGSAAAWNANANLQVSATFLMTGLTAGSNTFKLQYRVDGATFGFFNRYITVIPLP